MTAVRARSWTRAWSLGTSLFLAACASTELEVPKTHPGHPDVNPGRLQPTEALSSRFDVSPLDSASTAASASAPPQGNPTSAPQGTLYTCPMHPQIVRNAPGNCPICGMKLVPKDKEKTKP